MLASIDDNGAVRIHDTEKGVLVALLPGRRAAVTSIAFSPDGARLVSASADGAVRVWDVATGAEIAVLRHPEGSVAGARFSPKGDRIAIHGADGIMRRYTIFPSLEKLGADLKSTLPRQLTRQQRRQNQLSKIP